MLLEDLYVLTRRIAAVPVLFWLDEYQHQSNQLVKPLHSVLQNVERGSSAYTTISDLLDVLQQSIPNESQLVHSLHSIAVLYTSQNDINAELIAHYQASCQQFGKRVHTEEQFTKLRTKLKADLSNEEQHQYDMRLFLNEGMEYCLEFHLLFYRHLQSLHSELEQKKFICQPAVDIGSGNLPGLRADFLDDEVLEKFIYKILSDQEYSRLTKTYFFAKIKIIEAETEATREVLDVFKKFIQSQIISFQAMGIDRLSSGFFQPYGHQPLLNDVAKQL